MTMKPEFVNFNGMVFGGIIMAIADQAFAYATNSLLMSNLAIQFNIRLTASAAPGDELTAECNVVKSGRRITCIVGRVGNAVKVRGMFIVARQAEQAITGFDEISRYQLLVGRKKCRDTLVFRLEVKSAVSDGSGLLSGIAGKFQDVCRIKIDRIEFVDSGTIADDALCIRDERTWD